MFMQRFVHRMMSNYRVQMTDDSTMSDFNVVFHGPKESEDQLHRIASRPNN